MIIGEFIQILLAYGHHHAGMGNGGLNWGGIAHRMPSFRRQVPVAARPVLTAGKGLSGAAPTAVDEGFRCRRTRYKAQVENGKQFSSKYVYDNKSS